MTNFDILLSEAKFASFAEVEVSAEMILNIAPWPVCSIAAWRWENEFRCTDRQIQICHSKVP